PQIEESKAFSYLESQQDAQAKKDFVWLPIAKIFAPDAKYALFWKSLLPAWLALCSELRHSVDCAKALCFPYQNATAILLLMLRIQAFHRSFEVETTKSQDKLLL